MRSSRRVAAFAVLMAVGLVGAPASPAGAQDSRGEALFDLCAQCHGAAGEGNQLFLAPSIAGMSEWYVLAQLRKFRSGARGTHFDDLSGMRMRPMSLTLRSEADVEVVAKYVASLPPVKPAPVVAGGDPAKGQTAYALCTSCHGAKGEGLEPLNGSPLAYTSDWYLLSQLEKFKSGVRGSDPRDPIAIMMRPMALTLVDEQAMKDVVAYITTLAE
jgi:cytochrome c oxidase subunit 2